MDNTAWGFDVLPSEIKQLIFSFTDLDLTTVLRAQSASSEFKKLCWAWLRDTSANAAFVSRVNAELVRRIDCTRKDTVTSVLAALKLLPNVELVVFNCDEGDQNMEIIAKTISEFEQHPTLRWINYNDGLWLRDKNSSGSDLPPQSRFRRLKYDFNQLDPVDLDKAYHRGGTIGDKMIVIGATDGTLTFLTRGLEIQNGFTTDTLKVSSSTNDIHKDSINAIWSENGNQTYVASSDGVVSSWTCVNDEPVLNQTIVFPESILFVCDYADTYVLAAGKRTLYIAEIETNKIIREAVIDDDVTGLFGVIQVEPVLSTKNTLYTLKNDLTAAEVLQKHFDTPCPNLWLAPDASLRMVVHPTRVELMIHETNEISERVDVTAFVKHNDTAKFDTQPHLEARFSPTRYWMTVSIGTSLFTYSLERHCSIFEMRGAFGTDTKFEAFWYSPCGSFLYGLSSNNTLYWWHSCLLQVN